jgi:SNF2 family DNA or RNA helicase
MDHLGAALTSQGMEYVRIDGSLTLEQRSTAMDAFRNVPDIRIMLLSYGCGSVGFV